MFRMSGSILIAAMAGTLSLDSVANPADSRTDLVIALETQKTTVALYEPITLKYRIHNPTSDIIKATVVPEVRISMIDSTGTIRTYSPKRGCSGLIERSYPSGLIVSSDVDINESQIGPGQYQIRAKVQVGKDSYIESSMIQIEVLPPSTIDRQMIATFSSEDEFIRLLSAGPANYCRESSAQACFERLNDTLVQFPASGYTPSLTWDLAEAVASGVLEVRSRRDVAVGLFRRFLERWPTHPSAARVMYRLAMVLDEAGRYDEARSTIQQFAVRFPDEKEKIESLRVNFRSGQQVP